jgi:hypothetical protein
MCYLRYQDEPLDEAKFFQSKGAAVDAFERTARELDRYGQKIEASLHLGNKDDLSEYPDFVLSLGPRGGLRVERA